MPTPPPHDRRNSRRPFRNRVEDSDKANSLAESRDVYQAIDELCQELLVMYDDLVLQYLSADARYEIQETLSLQKALVNGVCETVAEVTECIDACLEILARESVEPRHLSASNSSDVHEMLHDPLTRASDASNIITADADGVLASHGVIESVCINELQVYYEDLPLLEQKDAIRRIRNLTTAGEELLDAVIADCTGDSAEDSIRDDWFPWPTTDAPASRFGFSGDFFLGLSYLRLPCTGPARMAACTSAGADSAVGRRSG